MFEINRDLLPVKAAYFFFNGAVQAAAGFTSVTCRNLAISPSLFGVVLTILKAILVFARLCLGAMVDRYQNLKAVMLITSGLGVIAIFSMAFIPSPNDADPLLIRSYMVADQASVNNPITIRYENIDLWCVSTIESNCAMVCNCERTSNDNLKRFCRNTVRNHTHKNNEDFLNNIKFEKQSFIEFEKSGSDDGKVSCLNYCPQGVELCLPNGVSQESLRRVSFFTSIALFHISLSSSGFLTHVLCLRRLHMKNYLIGRQTLWASVGTGVLSPLTGFLIDSIKFVGYPLAGMGFLSLALIVGMVIISLTSITNGKTSKSVFTETKTALNNWKALIFLGDTLVMGVCCSIKRTFVFWYLDALGASKLQMGLNVAVVCFVGAVPSKMVSPFLIRRWGYVRLIKLSFVFMFLKLYLYSLVTDPSTTLILELLQGPSVGLFATCMPSYADQIAPEGVKATMQSLVSTVFSGIGDCIGSLIGGYCVQVLGDRATFETAAIISLVWFFVSSSVHYFFYAVKERQTIKGNAKV